jgi:hypothetical protein
LSFGEKLRKKPVVPDEGRGIGERQQSGPLRFGLPGKDRVFIDFQKPCKCRDVSTEESMQEQLSILGKNRLVARGQCTGTVSQEIVCQPSDLQITRLMRSDGYPGILLPVRGRQAEVRT